MLRHWEMSGIFVGQGAGVREQGSECRMQTAFFCYFVASLFRMKMNGALYDSKVVESIFVIIPIVINRGLGLPWLAQNLSPVLRPNNTFYLIDENEQPCSTDGPYRVTLPLCGLLDASVFSAEALNWPTASAIIFFCRFPPCFFRFEDHVFSMRHGPCPTFPRVFGVCLP